MSEIERQNIRDMIAGMKEEELKDVASMIPSVILTNEVYHRLRRAEFRLSAIQSAFKAKSAGEIHLI